MKGRHTATRAMLLQEINRLTFALEQTAALARKVYSSDDPAGAVDLTIQHIRTTLDYTTVDGDPLPLGSERPRGEIGAALTRGVLRRSTARKRAAVTGDRREANRAIPEATLGSDYESAGERRHDE